MIPIPACYPGIRTLATKGKALKKDFENKFNFKKSLKENYSHCSPLLFGPVNIIRHLCVTVLWLVGA